MRALALASLCLGVVACGHGTPPPPTTAPPAHGHGHGGAGHHHSFDDAAAWSKVFDDPARDAWQQPSRVVEAMSIAPGMVVADIGAGTGYFEPYLSKAVGATGSVLAADVEPHMVEWLAARAKRENLANVRAVQAAPADPNLPAAKLDRILVVDTWHHIDDRPAYARKLAASLVAGGSVWIVDFTKESPHGPPAHARLAPAEIIGDLQAAGLTSEAVPVGLPNQYVVRGTR